MYNLSDTTKENLEKSFGMSLTAFNLMSADQEREWAEQMSKKTLVFSRKGRRRFMGKGKSSLACSKCRTLQDLDQKSRDLFGI